MSSPDTNSQVRAQPNLNFGTHRHARRRRVKLAFPGSSVRMRMSGSQWGFSQCWTFSVTAALVCPNTRILFCCTLKSVHFFLHKKEYILLVHSISGRIGTQQQFLCVWARVQATYMYPSSRYFYPILSKWGRKQCKNGAVSTWGPTVQQWLSYYCSKGLGQAGIYLISATVKQYKQLSCTTTLTLISSLSLFKKNAIK